MESHPFRTQNLHDLVGHVLVFFCEDLAASLYHGHLCSKTAEGLSHLNGYRTGPENDHGTRKLIEVENFFVGDVRCFIEAFYGRNTRRGPCGNDPVPGGNSVSVQSDRVFVTKEGSPNSTLAPRLQNLSSESCF